MISTTMFLALRHIAAHKRPIYVFIGIVHGYRIGWKTREGLVRRGLVEYYNLTSTSGKGSRRRTTKDVCMRITPAGKAFLSGYHAGFNAALAEEKARDFKPTLPDGPAQRLPPIPADQELRA